MGYLKLKFLNMKQITSISLSLVIVLLSSCGNQKSDNKNKFQLPENEWITLFDGETFEGWKIYGHDSITNEWQIIDGALVCHNGRRENMGFASTSIRTVESFGNFELELEYKIGKGGNSGIFYHVVESDEYGYDFLTAQSFKF